MLSPLYQPKRCYSKNKRKTLATKVHLLGEFMLFPQCVLTLSLSEFRENQFGQVLFFLTKIFILKFTHIIHTDKLYSW